MIKPVTELKRGDRVKGYRPMTVESVHPRRGLLMQEVIVVLFDSTLRLQYDPTEMVEVENDAKGDK